MDAAWIVWLEVTISRAGYWPMRCTGRLCISSGEMGLSFNARSWQSASKRDQYVRSRNNIHLLIFSCLEKLNGKFKSVNRWRRSESVTEKEYDDGWYVGETTKRNLRLWRLEACCSGLIEFVQERTWNILLFEWRQICWRMEQRQAGWKRDLLLY